MKRDTLYSARREDVEPFRFDADVAGVFDDMIRRSVPAYATVMTMTEALAARQAGVGGRAYDLGCSLGESSAAIVRGMGERLELLTAVDASPDMVAVCAQRFERVGQKRFLARCADVRDIAIVDASLVVINFTLMFLPPDQRDTFMSRVCKGLRPGGVLLLSEKVRPDNPETVRELHESFKAARAYSELEISQKREALENVLIPDRLETHRQRIDGAGFSSSVTWLQCLGFVSIIAWR